MNAMATPPRRSRRITAPPASSPTPSTPPSTLKLRLCLFQGRGAIRARHRPMKRERPEPPQIIRPAAHPHRCADVPPSGVDRVILPVLVDSRTEPGRAKFQSQWSAHAGGRQGKMLQWDIREILRKVFRFCYSAFASISFRTGI
jgi:hypothetical protein